MRSLDTFGLLKDKPRLTFEDIVDIAKEQDAEEFERHEDAFRDWVSSDRSSDYPVEWGRYHLYVSLACPWAPPCGW